MFAPDWNAAPQVGGTLDLPAVTHVFNATSAASGYGSGHPVTVELLWVGEYQLQVVSGVWTQWAGFASTLTETGGTAYVAVEVRSELTG
ncbi:MAG: hypothetical protein ACFCVC_18230 [Acidimicrobiia bacterium]